MNFQRYIISKFMRNQNITLNIRRKLSNENVSNNHKTSDFDKKVLVWTKTGNYKNVSEVPEYVGTQVIAKAKNRLRIRVANIMMALTALGCVVMIISGKRAHERGESVEKMGRDWHESINKKSSSN